MAAMKELSILVDDGREALAKLDALSMADEPSIFFNALHDCIETLRGITDLLS